MCAASLRRGSGNLSHGFKIILRFLFVSLVAQTNLADIIGVQARIGMIGRQAAANAIANFGGGFGLLFRFLRGLCL